MLALFCHSTKFTIPFAVLKSSLNFLVWLFKWFFYTLLVLFPITHDYGCEVLVMRLVHVPIIHFVYCGV